MICANCGQGFQFHCFRCGHNFEPETKCNRCHWWICPKCGSCGCSYNKPVKPFENAEIKKLSAGSNLADVLGWSWVKSAKLFNTYVSKCFFRKSLTETDTSLMLAKPKVNNRLRVRLILENKISTFMGRLHTQGENSEIGSQKEKER